MPWGTAEQRGRLWDVIDRPVMIAVYEDMRFPGHWVKHFFGPGEQLVVPEYVDITKISWFDGSMKEEALIFWQAKEASRLK